MSSTAESILDAPDMMNIYIYIFRQVSSTAERILDAPDMMNIYILFRQVSSTAERILDAPDMMNDFYLHLIDWSSLNHVAVALNGGMYIWNATDGTILQLFQDEEEQYVSSVKWVKVCTSV